MNLDTIIQVVCNEQGLQSHHIYLKKRSREIVETRQIISAFAKQMTELSLREIGQQVGGKSHCDVIHSIKVFNNEFETNKIFREKVNQINNKLMVLAMKKYAPKVSMQTYQERKMILL